MLWRRERCCTSGAGGRAGAARAHNGEGSAGWSDLLVDNNMTTTITDGETLLGTWDVYVIRVGSTLAVYAKGGGNGSTGYECHITQANFTTAALSMGFTGNPTAGIDAGTLYYQLGKASSSSK